MLKKHDRALKGRLNAEVGSGKPRMKKGELTRSAIVSSALELAGLEGLEGITLGKLAERMAMSKSGVFAHFGSREELQIAVLKAHERRFAEDVLLPALSRPRGLPRVRAIVERWIDHTGAAAGGGCLWIAGASELDDRPGPVRDVLVGMVRGWQRELMRAIAQAVEAGELRADLPPEDLLAGLFGVVLVLHHDRRLLRSPDALARARRVADRLLAEAAAAAPSARPRPAPRRPRESPAR
jgi:AcrR family transcriptional regulator